MAIRRVCWGLVDLAFSTPSTRPGHVSSSLPPCSGPLVETSSAKKGRVQRIPSDFDPVVCVKLFLVSALCGPIQSRLVQLLLRALNLTSPGPRFPSSRHLSEVAFRLLPTRRGISDLHGGLLHPSHKPHVAARGLCTSPLISVLLTVCRLFLTLVYASTSPLSVSCTICSSSWRAPVFP